MIAIGGRRSASSAKAKATLARRGLPDLERLDGIRALLAREGYDTAETIVALFSTTGFTSDLVRTAASRDNTELVDLERLYGQG